MILLSFDIEEFDLPLENGVNIEPEEQIRISSEGCNRILDCLEPYKVKATFFCTVQFAEKSPQIIQRIVEQGHEMASHGYYHSRFELAHLKRSRERLEEITGQIIHGFRMPRMQAVSNEDIRRAGYLYNSSLNPTFLPGRYNNLNKPRTWHYQDDVLQLPTSTTPLFRFPLFWLSIHHLASPIYLQLALRTFKHDGYFLTYQHPWEFMPLQQQKGVSRLIAHNTGLEMERRLIRLIRFFRDKDIPFCTLHDFIHGLRDKPVD